MKRVRLILFAIILNVFNSCEHKDDCSYIDMSHYIMNIQKINSKINNGFFTNADFNTDCCCYEITLPIGCCFPEDEFFDGIYEISGSLFLKNNVLFFSYEYFNSDIPDTVAFIDFNLNEGEYRTVLFQEGQFNCCQDNLNYSRKESKIIMKRIFYSKRHNDLVYKVVLENYLFEYGISYVVFISKESGILGNYCFVNSTHKYFSHNEDNPEVILKLSVQGDIFDDYFDYSKVRFVTIM